METGMKDDIKEKHGYRKTKDIFAFDEGLVKCNPPYSQLSDLSWLLWRHLTCPQKAGDEDVFGSELEDIKIMLEDALALLGNAVFS